MFEPIFAGFEAEAGVPERLMIDATHLKAHRTAASLAKKGLLAAASPNQGRVEPEAPRRVRRAGHPVAMLLTEGQVSDHKGAAILLPVRELLGDRG